MADNPVTTFFDAAVAQVKTVVTNTKTAAVVIFLAGALTGCVFH